MKIGAIAFIFVSTAWASLTLLPSRIFIVWYFHLHIRGNIVQCLPASVSWTLLLLGDLLKLHPFLMRIGLAHRELAARTLIGRAHIEGFCCTSTIDMRELMDNIHDASFRAINSLTVEVYALQIVDGRFLQHCREMGILSLGLYSGDYENRVTIDDMLDYCFSPSRNGLETTDRILSSSFFFDKAFFQHLLQAAEAQEELNYGIILTWDFADGDLSDHVIELEEEITKHYKSHGPFEIKMDLNDTVRVTALPCRCYAVRLDNGTGIVWRLDCENNRITVGVPSITSIQNPLLCMSPFSYKRDDTRRPFQVFMG